MPMMAMMNDVEDSTAHHLIRAKQRTDLPRRARRSDQIVSFSLFLQSGWIFVALVEQTPSTMYIRTIDARIIRKQDSFCSCDLSWKNAHRAQRPGKLWICRAGRAEASRWRRGDFRVGTAGAERTQRSAPGLN